MIYCITQGMLLVEKKILNICAGGQEGRIQIQITVYLD